MFLLGKRWFKRISKTFSTTLLITACLYVAVINIKQTGNSSFWIPQSRFLVGKDTFLSWTFRQDAEFLFDSDFTLHCYWYHILYRNLDYYQPLGSWYICLPMLLIKRRVCLKNTVGYSVGFHPGNFGTGRQHTRIQITG